MGIDVITIPLTMLALVGLLLWFIIGAKGHWIVKIIVTAIVVHLGLAVWFTYSELLGWPTSDQLPMKYEVHWVEVDEPAYQLDEGAIYVMVSDLDAADEQSILLSHAVNFSGPRLYKIPYTRDLHKQAQGMQEKIKNGGFVIMSRNPGKGQGKAKAGGGAGEQGKKGGEAKRPGFSGSEDHTPNPFGYEFNRPIYPAKPDQ